MLLPTAGRQSRVGESQNTCPERPLKDIPPPGTGAGVLRKAKRQMQRRLIAWLTAVMMASGIAGQELTDTIGEVVVTGTGTRHLLKDAPVQTEVITAAMLSNYGGQSIEDILSTLTSSFDFNEGDMGSQMQMSGLGNSYILVLIDGKRIHGDVGGENDLSLVDPDNIERIEIVKGASSALYGSDAIAGVVNIITKKHDEGLLLENTTRTGSYGEVRQHNGIGFRIGKVSSYTNFNYRHSDGWQNTSTEDVNQTEFLITDSRNKTVNENRSWQIAERLTWQPLDRLSIYAEGSYHWKRRYRKSGKYASTDVYTYDLEYHNASASLGAEWKLNATDVITADVDWNKHAYYYFFTDTTLTDRYVDGELDHYFPYFPGQKQLQSDQQRTMAQVKGVFALPAENRLTAGLEWRYDWLNAPTRVEGGTVDDNTGAAYVQDEFSLLSPLFVTAGLRLNYNESFGTKLTPKISAMLSLGDFRIRATWSEGFKSPTPKELYYRYIRQMSGTYLYLGNTDLKAQTSDYFSLGVEYRTNKWAVSLTGYYNHVDDMIELVTISQSEAPGELIAEYQPLKVRQYRNLESAKTYGVDLTLSWMPTDEITVGAGYSYLDTDAEEYDDDKEELQKVTIDGMAHHKANIYATWGHRFSAAYRLGVGVYGKASSKRYYQDDGNGRAYQIWKLSTTHDFGNSKTMTYRLEAGVDNIFNFVDKTDHGLHLGTTSPGTTVYASFTIRLSRGKKIGRSNINHNNNTTYEED